MQLITRVAAAPDLDQAALLEPYRTTDEVARRIDEGNIILAQIGEEVVGYVRLEGFWPQMPYLGMIRVDEEWRERGIGTAMIEFLRVELAQRGCVALLSSSQADEPEPQHWHRRTGFEECGFLAGVNDVGVGEVFFILRL